LIGRGDQIPKCQIYFIFVFHTSIIFHNIE
jgi:hypothetical protein